MADEEAPELIEGEAAGEGEEGAEEDEGEDEGAGEEEDEEEDEGEAAAGEGPPPEEPEEKPLPSNQDALSMEFLYYGSVLKVVAPTLTNVTDRKMVVPWVQKLLRPEYQTSRLREKRNRYLVALTLNILSDEIGGIFQNPPPEDVLIDLKTLNPEPSTAAEWELDRMWQETLLALPDDFEPMGCCVHETPEECNADHKLDKVLDQEFQFLLYLSRPYATLLPAEDKCRTAAWLQTLCTIHGEHCSSMKAIRNDYIMTLLGYLHDLRIVGPFVDYPPDILEPLEAAAKKAARINPVIDPTGPDANQFLLDQPVPDDGAFCYVAVTGDLVASSL